MVLASGDDFIDRCLSVGDVPPIERFFLHFLAQVRNHAPFRIRARLSIALDTPFPVRTFVHLHIGVDACLVRMDTVPAEEVLDEGVHVGKGVVYRHLDNTIHALEPVKLESELDPGVRRWRKGEVRVWARRVNLRLNFQELWRHQHVGCVAAPLLHPREQGVRRDIVLFRVVGVPWALPIGQGRRARHRSRRPTE